MLRRVPLKAKSHYKPVELRRYHDWVAALGCIVCGSPAEVHHVSGYADRPGRITRSDWLVTPLCPTHHRVGATGGFRQSVEALSHQGFFREWGIDLHAEALRLADEWRGAAA